MGSDSSIPDSPPPSHHVAPLSEIEALDAGRVRAVATGVIAKQPPSAAAAFFGGIVGFVSDAIDNARRPPSEPLGAPPLMRVTLNYASLKWGDDATAFKGESVDVPGKTLNFRAMLPADQQEAPFTLSELPDEAQRLPELQKLAQEGMTIAMQVGNSVYVAGSAYITVDRSGTAHFHLGSQKIPFYGDSCYLILAPFSTIETLQGQNLSTLVGKNPRDASEALSQIVGGENGAICVIDLSKSL